MNTQIDFALLPPSRPCRPFFSWFLRVTFVLFLSGQVRAQSNQSWGTWLVTTVQLPGGERGWGGYVEAQARMNGLFKGFTYHEYKGGVSYDISKNFTVLLGLGRYTTFDPNELDATPLVREVRLWQQLIQSQAINRLRFEHRYRVEQRWLDHRGESEYRNRIRYRLNLQIPLNNDQLDDRTWFVSTYNEIFLNPNLIPFEQNRLYTGLGYKIDRKWVVQAGWLNQFQYSPGPIRHKNNLVLMAIFTVPRLHEGIRRLPTPVD